MKKINKLFPQTQHWDKNSFCNHWEKQFIPAPRKNDQH